MRNRPAQRRRFLVVILPTTIEELDVASHAQMHVFHCERTQDECLTRRTFGLTRAAFDGPIEHLAPNVSLQP